MQDDNTNQNPMGAPASTPEPTQTPPPAADPMGTPAPSADMPPAAPAETPMGGNEEPGSNPGGTGMPPTPGV